MSSDVWADVIREDEERALNAACAKAVLAFALWCESLNYDAEPVILAHAFIAAQGWLPQGPKEEA